MSGAKIGLLLLKLLLNIVLIWANSPIKDTNLRNHSTRNSRSYETIVAEPILYELHLIPKFIFTQHTNIIEGKANIKIDIVKLTNVISLHMNKWAILINKITFSTADTSTEYTLLEKTYDIEEHLLHLHFKETFMFGYHWLNFTFVTNPFQDKDNPVFIKNKCTDTNNNEQWFMTTLAKPSMAHRLFPCLNVPNIRTRFSLTVKHPQEYTVLTNAQLDERIVVEDNLIRTKFKTSDLILTYHFMIAFFKYATYVNNNDTDWVICGREINEQQFHILKKYIDYAHDFLKNYTKTNLVYYRNYAIVSRLPVQTIESVGFQVYNKKNIYNKKFDDTERKYRKIHITVRGATYQFFNQVVYASSWNELWLSRALTSFFAYYALSEIRFTTTELDYFMGSGIQNALQNDDDFQISSIEHQVNSFDEIDEYISPVNHERDIAIIRMLQHTLKKEIFQHGMEIFCHSHPGKETTTNHFWNTMMDAAREHGVEIENLGEIMNSWIKNRNYPIVTVTRNYTTGEVIIKQHPNHHNTSHFTKWFVPITFTQESDQKFSRTWNIHWLRPENESLSLYVNGNEWIIVNLQQVGYYRVNYDMTNWLKIANYLNSADYLKIDWNTRAQIIDDAYYFLAKEDSKFFTFLTIIKCIKKDTSSIIWITVDRILSKMMPLFKFPESYLIKKFILTVLTETVKLVTYDDDIIPDEMAKKVRSVAIQWLCRLGDEKCRTKMHRKLLAYLNQPEAMSESWKDLIYCTGMMTANESTANDLISTFQSERGEERERIFYYITCSERSKPILTYLDHIAEFMKYSDKYTRSMYYRLYDAIIKNHIDRPKILSFVLKNIEYFTNESNNWIKEILHIISYICTNNNLDNLQEYLKSTTYINELERKEIEFEIQNRRTIIDQSLTWMKNINLILMR